jgi:hypothetical protein
MVPPVKCAPFATRDYTLPPRATDDHGRRSADSGSSRIAECRHGAGVERDDDDRRRRCEKNDVPDR